MTIITELIMTIIAHLTDYPMNKDFKHSKQVFKPKKSFGSTQKKLWREIPVMEKDDQMIYLMMVHKRMQFTNRLLLLMNLDNTRPCWSI